MIKVEIKSAETNPREITAKTGPNAGNQMTFHEQEAYAFTSDDNGQPRPYPQRITLNIDRQKGQQPYAVGMYLICPSSVFVDRFSNLQLGRLKLRPITQAVQAAVKAA